MAIKGGPRVNLNGFALLMGGVWALAVTLLSAGWLEGAALPVALVAVAAAVAALLLAAGASRRRDAQLAKLSSDITAVAGRLLRVEASEVPAAAPGDADESRWVRRATEGLAGDVELLGRVVGELAEKVGDHDRLIASIEMKAVSPPPSAPPVPIPALDPDEQRRPRPSAAEMPRDEIARVASAILRKLAPDHRPAEAPARSGPSPSAPDVAANVDIVSDAMEAGRIELYLQPVVTLPQRRTRFYQALPRLRAADGGLLLPAEFLPVLERQGRIPELEGFVLARSFAIGRHLAGRDSAAAVSCSLSPVSLGHPSFFQAAEELYEADRTASRRVLIEIRHLELDRLRPAEATALARLHGLGARLILERCSDLRSDWAGLVRRGFDLAKMDSQLILEPRPPGATSALIQAAAEAGIQLIATGVGRESIVPDLLDFDLPLAQGDALAPARPVRAEVVSAAAATPPAPSPPATTEPATAAEQGRVSFREFLRRAG